MKSGKYKFIKES